MLFNSLSFIVFFPAVALVYFVVPLRVRWLFLLVASYYFYMNWNPAYALLILTSTIVTWFCGLLLESEENIRVKKLYLVASLGVNFSILFVYKYFNFVNSSIYLVLDYLDIRWVVPNLDLLLPVGISFYTFQAVGYTIDVYKQRIKAERHLGIYALFISFFPQLVAGPIERAANLLPQFHEQKTFKLENLSAGIKMMLWGFFLKIVLADRLAIYVDAVYNNIEQHNGSSHLLASILFAFQIYGDFAGYSLIAIGVARILGFKLMKNFDSPYFATNVATFWSRWHISLSTWFKDYLYIPLGGNRVSAERHYFNIFITFLVSGIWHGANFTFVVWGALHGVYLMIEKFFALSKKKIRTSFTVSNLLSMLITFILVDFAWIFFRSDNITDSLYIISKIFTDITGPLFLKWDVFFAVGIALLILICKEAAEEFFPDKFLLLHNKNIMVSSVSSAILVAIIVLFGVFNAGQFIYFQF